MNKTKEPFVALDAANVSRRAYQLWESAGRPAGRDLEFWLAAEGQVRAMATSAAVAATVVVPAAVPSDPKAAKPSRAARGEAKKTWPKPYPALPKL